MYKSLQVILNTFRGWMMNIQTGFLKLNKKLLKQDFKLKDFVNCLDYNLSSWDHV